METAQADIGQEGQCRSASAEAASSLSRRRMTNAECRTPNEQRASGTCPSIDIRHSAFGVRHFHSQGNAGAADRSAGSQSGVEPPQSRASATGGVRGTGFPVECGAGNAGRCVVARPPSSLVIRAPSFTRHSSFGIRHSTRRASMGTAPAQGLRRSRASCVVFVARRAAVGQAMPMSCLAMSTADAASGAYPSAPISSA